MLVQPLINSTTDNPRQLPIVFFTPTDYPFVIRGAIRKWNQDYLNAVKDGYMD